MPVVAVEHDRTFVFLDIVLVVDIQRVRELRLKSRVTLGDVERIRVVSDVEQLSHFRLTGITAIMEPDVVLIGKLIVKVDGWGEIHHIADGIYIDAAIVLYEIGVLGLHEEAHVIVIFLLQVAQGQSHVVREVLVFRVAAEFLVEVFIHR